MQVTEGELRLKSLMAETNRKSLQYTCTPIGFLTRFERESVLASLVDIYQQLQHRVCAVPAPQGSGNECIRRKGNQETGRVVALWNVSPRNAIMLSH